MNNRLPLYHRGMAFPARRLIKPAPQMGQKSGRSLQMEQGDRTYSFDANNVLSDGAAAYTAAGYAQSGGAQGVVDLGGNQGVTITLPSIANSTTITPQQPRIDAACVIDVTAATVAGSDLYRLILVGSNDPNFGAGNVQILGAMQFGEASAMDFVNGINTPAPAAIGGSRYELLFTNEQNNVKYQFLALYNGGTFGSITYRAFVAVLPRE
jgi:hypothetical protein